MKMTFIRNPYNRLKSYPTLTTLNEVTIDDSSSHSENNAGHSISKQTNPEKDSIMYFRTVHLNLVPVGHFPSLPGHTTSNTLQPPTKHGGPDKIDDIGPEYRIPNIQTINPPK